MPKVSILMPVYAPQPDFLREAITSVQKQTFTDWTLAIREDPSHVNTEEIVRPFLSDQRISFQRNPVRLGIGGNWNACLRSAAGTYVQFLFQDDLWEPEYLARSADALENSPSAGMVIAQHTYRAEGTDAETFLEAAGLRTIETMRGGLRPGTTNGKAFLTDWLRRGLHPNIIGEPSFVMLRRSIVEQAGLFREDLHQNLDHEYWTRMLLLGDVHFQKDNLGTFRVHVGGASMMHDTTGEGIFDRLRIFVLLLHSLPDGELRNEANHSLHEQVRKMGSKFRHRVSDGKRAVGSGGMLRIIPFFLRHPLLLAEALRGVLIA
ncbi:MAG: glycosyltransferase [Candidatus Peribacteraceae bacterium]|jgi:glycosyltransferase involved in cell wall biosynthesis